VTEPADTVDRVRGCLLGGAVGDALGAGVEFDWMEDIHRKLGPAGVTDYVEAYGRRGAITDDTQLTLFTAEGLLLADGVADVRSVVDRAYARWLRTQGEHSSRWPADDGGWLAGVPALNERRAPGRTCLSALKADRAGSVAAPSNESKGCGGVMRIAPVGLLRGGLGGDPFDLGCEIAALTHGHPSGYLAAGAMALIVARLLDGAPLDAALDAAEQRLAGRPRHEETLDALRAARTLAASGAEPGPEMIATLGAGWVAEEALAIGVYGALVARDFTHGVLIAVNHSGDCDSTAAITGSLLGTMIGVDAIPDAWLAELEVRDEIERLAAEWIARFA
jgi:ADP-ribosyl-[dinitrogen reductase] hydrolase